MNMLGALRARRRSEWVFGSDIRKRRRLFDR
jgi:hypothetical protein